MLLGLILLQRWILNVMMSFIVFMMVIFNEMCLFERYVMDLFNFITCIIEYCVFFFFLYEIYLYEHHGMSLPEIYVMSL